MGDLFSSKQKTTSTQSTKIPANFQNLMNRTISFANEGLDTPFQSYNAPRIAELSGNEQAGIASAGNNAGLYQDLINMSMVNNADMQAQGGLPSQGDIQGLINPYVDYVLGNSLNRLNETSDRNMTNIGGMAGMAGAFGGSRHGVLEGANLAELLKSSQELSANTYSDAYDKGMSNWFQGQNLRRGTIQDGMNIATQGQQYNTQDINNLMNTGLTERTRNQGLLDFAYSEFMREQQDPFTKAGFAGSVMGAYPTNLFTRTGVEETTQTPSAFSQIAGVGLAAAGLMTGNPAALAGLGSGAASLGSGGGGAFQGIGTMGSVGNSGGQLGYVQPTGIAGTNYSGVAPRYQEGGMVEKPNDPIGQLIRDLEEQDRKKAKGEKVSLRERMKNGRQSTNVEDRRARVQMSPDAEKASRIPMGSKSNMLRDLINGLGGEYQSDPFEWYKRDDPEANLYQYLMHGVDPDDPSYENNGADIKRQHDASMAMRYGSKLDPNDFYGAVPAGVKPFAKGGKVNKVKPDKDGVYRAGSGGWFDDVMNVISPAYMLGDMNPKNQEMVEPNSILYGASGGGQGGERHRGYSEPQATTQRQPFDWNAFVQRMGIQNFVSPNTQNTFPSQSAPRLPSRTPDLSGYMQQMNQRIAGQGLQGSPRGFAGGGEVVISGNKKTRVPRGSHLKDGMPHDGSPEDITYLLDQFPDEEWTPTEGNFDGTHQPVEVDEEAVYDNWLTTHESGAKEFGKPNWKARPIKDGKPMSSAFGIAQILSDPPKGGGLSNWDKVRKLAKKDGYELAPANSKLLDEGKFPSLQDQQIGLKYWKQLQAKELGDNYKDPLLRFAHHQMGGNALNKVLKADVNTKLKDVIGEEAARNVSAYNKDRNETFGEYLARIEGGPKGRSAAYNWEKNRITSKGGNLTHVVSAEPTDPTAMLAERRPHNLGKFTEDQIRQAMRASGDTVFRGVQPDGRQSRIRKGPDLGEPLSALETVMGGKLPENAPPDYLDSLLSVPVTREALDDPRFVKGGRRPTGYSKGGTIKYAEGDLIKMPDGTYRKKDGTDATLLTGGQKVYHDAVNKARKAVGAQEFKDGKWNLIDQYPTIDDAGDAAYQDLKDIWATKRKGKSGIAVVDDILGKTLASGVPIAGMMGAGAAKLGGGALDFLFNDAGLDSPEAPKVPVKSSAKSKFNELNMGLPGYGNEQPTPLDFGTEPDNLIEGVGTGNVDGVLADPLARMASGRNDEVQSELDSLMLDRIRALKNEQETETDPLKGIFGDYNQGLFKMGMGILANSGYPNSAGEAIAKGVLGAQESEENRMLAKNERRNARLKELLNARYMNAMIEQMSPEQKLAVEKLKGEYDLKVEGMKDQRAEMQKQADFKRSSQLEVIKSLMTKAQLGGLSKQESDYLKSLTGYQSPIDTSDIEDTD